MFSLELKIPPVLFTLLCMLTMFLCHAYLSGNVFSLCSDAHDDNKCSMMMRILWWLSWTSLGLGFALAGKIEFDRNKTTVNPMTPNKTSSLVQSGVYAWSRNPMYVGFLACIVGWAFLMMDLMMVVFIPFFVWYMNKFQIEPEERFLQDLFGKEFVEYKNKVKRWLFI